VRILYYNSAYHADYGGSNHARGFFAAAARHPRVTSIEVFPPAVNRNTQDKVSLRWRVSTALPRHIRLPLYLALGNRAQYDQLCRRLKRCNVDVLIVRAESHFMELPRLRRRFPQLFIAVEVNASVFDESMAFVRPLQLYRRLEAWALASCHVRIFVSAFLRDRIRSFYPADSHDIVVHNGVDLNKFRPRIGRTEAKRRLGIHPKRAVVGYIGGMESFRRLPLLIEAYADVLKERPDAILMLAGDGVDMSLVQERASRLGLLSSQRVQLMGWVPGEVVPALLEAFDVGVFHASNPYGSPQKLFEYLAMRLPTVGPRVPAVTEVFQHGTHMLLTEPRREEVASCILGLLQDRELGARLAEAGYALVASKYTWDHNAEAVVASLEKVRIQTQQDG